jgi:quercetin dioxygenase-like cupin family protein
VKVENDNLFHKGSPMPEAYALYFSGQAYLNPLTKSLNIANVTFEPGCRNNWHIHHKGGQILLVTAGRGWYQAWGETARELHPGDVVEIPPETKHWHGAASDNWMSHLAIEIPSVGGSVEWLEAVNADEFAHLNETKE